MGDWTERYRPTSLAEIRGNNKARDQLRDWAQSWPDHREAVIVHGDPGIGKTSAAHALAADMGWDVVELNASDSRTREVVDRVAGEAATSGTLTSGESGRRLIILDEADNFHGNADYGGASAVTDIVKDASQPVVLIANEYYEMSRTLRDTCQDIEFRQLSTRSIVPVLRDICRKENIEFEEQALQALAESADGDLRSAINDLQATTEQGGSITEADIATGRRDRTVDIFPFLDAVLQEQSPQDALQTAYDVDETPDDLINWIEDNLPKEYQDAELATAYRHLSTADRWLGRVRATQNYTFWRYATDAMVAGVAASRSRSTGGWTRYGPPSMRSKLGRSRGRRNTRDTIAARIAEAEGTSIATARRLILPYLSAMIHHCRPRELTVAVAAAYDLDADDIAFITGSGADTNKVATIVDDAISLRTEAAVPEPTETASTDTATTDEAPAEASDETTTTKPDDDTATEDSDSSDTQTGLGEFL